MINRVLIANRGEIALRIIRACHEEGLEAVAVYSEADASSPHVRAADLAVPIGPAPASESYLRAEVLVEAARRTGAQGIHPGYGFLSERAAFAEAVEQAGLIFIGPPSSAIRAMGDKPEARRRMRDAGVPVVPGSAGPVAGLEAARAAADQIGYPVMVKAAAGGGGKGMRLVGSPSELAGALEAAASEARKAFGDDAVYLEKYIVRPRHVEIQILADFAKTIHLGERECSIQRRHQKLLEECPSAVVTPELRRAIGMAAVSAAAAVGYRNAGTCEFLLDAEGKFYFLEMNTRLQVEHPITELVYGVDLVREQLRIARGKPMSVSEWPLNPRGHSIECRITSEDPSNGFLPSTGTISYLSTPGGPGVRWDSGVETGDVVSRHYDSLLAKLIVHGADRESAIGRMLRALDELVVVGVATNQGFFRRLLVDPEFRRGEIDIQFLDRRQDLLNPSADPERDLRVAIAAALAEDGRRARGVGGRKAVGDVGEVGGVGEDGRQQSRWTAVGRLEGLR